MKGTLKKPTVDVTAAMEAANDLTAITARQEPETGTETNIMENGSSKMTEKDCLHNIIAELTWLMNNAAGEGGFKYYDPHKADPKTNAYIEALKKIRIAVGRLVGHGTYF